MSLTCTFRSHHSREDHPGRLKFPRHVGPGPAPSYAAYKRLRRDIDRLTYVVEWMTVELQALSQREGLPP
ncbi:hypothetical protein Hanom_Chr12g01112761 [Helianthus anomalus]